MLLSSKMISGFNTDVQHEGHVYHVQTEDCGVDNLAFESLVYVGGTVVAKKRTPYSEQLGPGAPDEVIASLLKRQHHVMIAAIKAGRIEDLIRHSAKEQTGKTQGLGSITPAAPGLVAQNSPANEKKPAVKDEARPEPLNGSSAAEINRAASSRAPEQNSSKASARPRSAGLDLDQVVSDYLTRNAQQQKFELKVLTPEVFTAGKSVGLRVLVSCGGKAESDAVVTIKVIGTAFKPQVYIGRSAMDGVASFSLAIPAFTAGTAAIVIEGQSKRGRGDVKQLIRRS
ncbi:MAG TPA: hypothetical protein VNS63_01500 [Blastocatellia bacterium]|nr:hypothetical protein [Blastocatellia bacterium]